MRVFYYLIFFRILIHMKSQVKNRSLSLEYHSVEPYGKKATMESYTRRRPMLRQCKVSYKKRSSLALWNLCSYEFFVECTQWVITYIFNAKPFSILLSTKYVKFFLDNNVHKELFGQFVQRFLDNSCPIF